MKFDDPICSHCWAIEPVLRRFVEQYGLYFNFHMALRIHLCGQEVFDQGSKINSQCQLRTEVQTLQLPRYLYTNNMTRLIRKKYTKLHMNDKIRVYWMIIWNDCI